MTIKFLSPLTISFFILITASIIQVITDRSGGWGWVVASTFTITGSILLAAHFILIFFLKDRPPLIWWIETAIVILLIIYAWKDGFPFESLLKPWK
ncbi:MAG TPA: hypothetical protein VGA21_06930 [Cyclobacteriaceae bacterium]